MALWKRLQMFRVFPACHAVMAVQSGPSPLATTLSGLAGRCETAGCRPVCLGGFERRWAKDASGSFSGLFGRL